MKRLSTMLLAMALIFPVLAAAVDRPDGWGRAPRERNDTNARRQGRGGLEGMLGNPRMIKKLGLSEEQQVAIKAQAEITQAAHRELKAEMEQAALKQATLMTAKALDEDALMAAVEETGKIRTELAKLHMKHLLFMRSVLTPEQTEMLQTFRSERMKGQSHEGRRGDRKRGGEIRAD